MADKKDQEIGSLGKGEKSSSIDYMNNNNSARYDYSFKILLIGDSGVGKSSLLLSFISNSVLHHDLSPTIGECRTVLLHCLILGSFLFLIFLFLHPKLYARF